MDKKPLHEFYDDLIPELWNELMFFIPINQVPDEVIDKLEFLKKQGINNRILVMDYYRGPIFYEKDRSNKEVLQKGYKLDKNIFELLEKKKTSKSFEFGYVLEKYFEQVEFLFYIVNWMRLNLNQAAKVDDTIKGVFYFQYSHYKKHFETLIKHFYPNRSEIPRGNFNTKHLIDTYFPDIVKGFKHKEQLGKRQIESKQQAKDQLKFSKVKFVSIEQPIKAKKKKPLLIEQEAEKALLKTIFKIDIK